MLKHNRGNLLQKLTLVLVSICSILYFYTAKFYNVTTLRELNFILTKDLIHGCPSYGYKFDLPDILQRLGEPRNEPECQRTPGLTLFENGRIRMNRQASDYGTCYCNASCVFRTHNYEYSLGNDCIVNKNCRRFRCDFIYVNCWRNKTLIHIDVHTQIWEHWRNREKKFGVLYRETRSIELKKRRDLWRANVFVIILDSAGRFPALRQLKKTYKFMMDEMGAIDFKQYTQVGGSSRQNAFSAFLGMVGVNVDRNVYGGTTIETNFKCHEPNDNKSYIQFEYEDSGYRTLFAEDYFTDLYAYLDCDGFENELATHYNRPFVLLSLLRDQVWDNSQFNKTNFTYLNKTLLTKHLRNANKCGEAHHHVLRYFEQFVNSYDNTPKMGIMWTNEAHDDERAYRRSDPYFVKFLQENKEKLDDAFVMVMGDHGQRSGMVVGTRQGPFEGTNTLMLFSLPKRLRETSLGQVVRKNGDQLFSNHDLHATLVDIVRHQPLSNFRDSTFLKINDTLGNSWLRELDPDLPRDCRHLPIPSLFCPCNYGREEAIGRDDTIYLILPKLIESNYNYILDQNRLLKFCEPIAVKNITDVILIQTGLGSTFFQADFFTKREAHLSAFFKPDVKGELQLTPRDFVRRNKYGKTADCLLAVPDLISFRHICYCTDHPTNI